MNQFQTQNNLKFYSTPFPSFFEDEEWLEYKVGTVKGLWNCDNENYIILSFVNEEKNNGHLQDVFQWFENSCKRDQKNLLIKEIVNEKFYKHLIEKRGFEKVNNNKNELIKYINK